MLKKQFIQLIDNCNDWKEAIKIAARPLLENDYITNNYVTKMISNIESLGPYIIVLPKLAIPHARPEDGAKKSAISVLKVKTSVYFSENSENEVSILIVLSSVDSNKHLSTLREVLNVLSDEAHYKALLKAQSIEDIYYIFNSKKGGE